MSTDLSRLRALDLRDRWGYAFSDEKLLAVATWVQGMPDADADALGLAMLLGELPVACEDYDTPAEDELLEEILNAARGGESG